MLPSRGVVRRQPLRKRWATSSSFVLRAFDLPTQREQGPSQDPRPDCHLPPKKLLACRLIGSRYASTSA